MRNRVVFLVILFLVSVANTVILLPGKIEDAARAEVIVSKKYQAKKAYIEKKRQKIKEKFSLKVNQTAKNTLLTVPGPVSATTVTLIAPQDKNELPPNVADESLKNDPFSKGLPEIRQSTQSE